MRTVYPKKYAHGFCFAVLCCGYTLTDFPISIRLTSLALWQSNDCPSASKATLMNMDKYFMWNQYERLHNHNKAKHNKTVCIFLGIYCINALLYGSLCVCGYICTCVHVFMKLILISSMLPAQTRWHTYQTMNNKWYQYCGRFMFETNAGAHSIYMHRMIHTGQIENWPIASTDWIKWQNSRLCRICVN